MTRDRYALLGLGHARASWFGNVSLWATSGAIPADFAKCLSTAEVRQRLTGLQPFSALLVEARVAGVDRDLIATAQRAGVATIIIDATEHAIETWTELGASAVLPPTFSPADLLYALSTHATIINQPSDSDVVAFVENITAHAGRLVTVCGPGGTGASTTAVALAQGIADDPLETGLVLLADLSRNAEQAMLHDATDVVPGIEELVEANRGRRPASDDVRALTFGMPSRGYRLLLGLRRSHAWSGLPPKSVEAAITSLRRAFRTVVADITADFEGESQGGSIDVEERNAMARITALASDVVVVVGTPGMKGTHSLARTIRDLLSLGVAQERILPVVVRAPKHSAARAEIVAAVGALVHRDGVATSVATPIFLADRSVDDVLRDGVRIPQSLTAPLVSAVNALHQRSSELTPEESFDEETPIAPGSLGTSTGFFDEAAGE